MGCCYLQDGRQRLAEQGIASAISESRRGGHLFVFLDEPVPARDARALAMLALGPEEVDRMARGEEAFEIYPKQEQRGSRDGAVGSNIALPLGVHLKDGQRHPFVDRHGEAWRRTLRGQLDYLRASLRAGCKRCCVIATGSTRPSIVPPIPSGHVSWRGRPAGGRNGSGRRRRRCSGRSSSTRPGRLLAGATAAGVAR